MSTKNISTGVLPSCPLFICSMLLPCQNACSMRWDSELRYGPQEPSECCHSHRLC